MTTEEMLDILESFRGAVNYWNRDRDGKTTNYSEPQRKIDDNFDAIRAALTERDSLKVQIDRLANFIMAEIPGEPSQSQGAIDTAIRIMKAQKAKLAEYVRRARAIREASWNDQLFENRPQDLIRDLAGEGEKL